MTKVAEFTVTLKGDPVKVGRMLRAFQNEYSAIEREADDFMRAVYRDFGMPLEGMRRAQLGIEGTITIKHADADLLGWH